MILLDTDVLIAHLRGHQAAREWLRSTRVEGRLAASAITVKELTDAMRSPERREIARLLSTLSLKAGHPADRAASGSAHAGLPTIALGDRLGDCLVARPQSWV